LSIAKKPYHHGQLREALLDAGDELLAAEGLRGFTLRACARLAGVSHAAPKHHFQDATGFLTALAARGFERLTERLRAGIRQTENLDEEFIATARAYVGFAEDNPEHFRIMFRHDLLNVESDHLYYQVSSTLTELTNSILRQRGETEISIAQLSQHVRKTDELIQDIIIGWCHIHGLAHLITEQQLDMMPPDRQSELIDQAAIRIARMIRQDEGV